jgi:hypothetical protein
MYKSRTTKTGLKRKARGAGILILLVLISVAIVLFMVAPIIDGSKQWLTHFKQVDAVDASALAAATELSRIVINDPYFGFISLSDYPPIGKATLAGDGEPLPVNSINSLLATCRLEMLLATCLDNEVMMNEARHDLTEYRRASRNFEQVLEKAIAPSSEAIAFDLNGEPVKPYEKAKEAYLQCRGISRCDHEPNLIVSLGWATGNIATRTPVPGDATLALLPNDKRQSEFYPAFQDLPIGAESFFFAGVYSQAALVRSDAFMPPDGKRFSSIVRVALGRPDPDQTGSGKPNTSNEQNIQAVSCAVPCSLQLHRVPGVMSLGFPDGLLPGITSIGDLLRSDKLKRLRGPVICYAATAGDFPSNDRSYLREARTDVGQTDLAGLVSKGICDWVRNCGCQAKLESLLAAINQRFDDPQIPGSGLQQSPILLYEMNRNGSVSVIKQAGNPFPNQVASENQIYALGLSAIELGDYIWTVQFRDNVAHLGTTCGGRHAGEPLCSPIVNWSELSQFDGSPDASAAKGKGNKGLGLTVTGAPATAAGEIPSTTAYFEKQQGETLVYQPRKSYYSGGLAVDMRFSSPLLKQVADNTPTLGEKLASRVKL